MKQTTSVNKPKRPTILSVKAFIRNNQGKLFIHVLSKFNSQTDGVERVGTGFDLACMDLDHPAHTFGITGAWFVGEGRDTISVYEEAHFEGFKITNSTGSFILAVAK